MKVQDPNKRLNLAYQNGKQKGHLKLANMGLTAIPDEVHRFNEVTLPGDNWWQDVPLTLVDLSNNDIVQLDPRIAFLREVEVFKMINNKIEEIPPGFLSFENLKILDLSGNRIKTIPQEIGQQVTLIEIDLSNNMINELPNSITSLSTLENLKLAGNRIQHVPQNVDLLII